MCRMDNWSHLNPNILRGILLHNHNRNLLCHRNLLKIEEEACKNLSMWRLIPRLTVTDSVTSGPSIASIPSTPWKCLKSHHVEEENL